MRNLVGFSAIALGLIALSGCERRERVGERRDNEIKPALETPPQTTGPRVANHTAVQSIAEARCEREARCDNLGNDKKYPNRAECKTSLVDKNNDQLARTECPGGVDQKELRECLDQIKNEDCNNPLDALERLAACRTADLCVASR